MKRLRRMRDIALLCIVIIYSGAHMPSSGAFSRISQSFAEGFARGYAQHK
jgi:hypothetical protein